MDAAYRKLLRVAIDAKTREVMYRRTRIDLHLEGMSRDRVSMRAVLIKRCAFERCEQTFETDNQLRKYCTDRCKTRATKRRQTERYRERRSHT